MISSSRAFTKEEIARRGNEIYNNDVRPLVESEQNKGKFVLIDIESGVWEMDADEMKASRRMEGHSANAQIWMVRVGYSYVRRFGSGQLRGAA